MIKTVVKADEVGSEYAVTILMSKGEEPGAECYVLRMKAGGWGGKTAEHSWEVVEKGAQPLPTLRLGREALLSLAEALSPHTEQEAEAGFYKEAYGRETARVDKLIDHILENM